MTLRDDIRNHFARDEGLFPTPAGLRSSVTSEASRAELSERRTIQWAAALAVVLAVAVVAGLLASGALRHAQILPAVSPSPRGTTEPSNTNINVVEIDAVDPSTAFALLDTSPPPNSRPQFWFSSTIDGGAHWSPPVKVGPPLAAGEGDSGHHIHFVDANNGIFYGNSTALVTHDGGRTWHDSGLQMLEMVVATGRSPWMWAVTYPCAKGTMPVCAYKVYLSNNAGRTWGKSWDLPGNIQPRYADAFGDGGLVVTSNATGDMYFTTDGGASWTNVRGRCSGDSAVALSATADGRELWQTCMAGPPGFSMAMYVSTNGGATWVKRTMPLAGTLAQLFSPEPGTAFLLSAKTPIQVTRDGGKTWKAVDPESVYSQIVFTSSTEAWAVRVDGSFRATHDGGRTWTPVMAPPMP